MEPTLEQPSEHGTEPFQSFPSVDLPKSSGSERGLPLALRPVCVAKRYTVSDIAHPVDQPLPRMAQLPSQMVLDDHLVFSKGLHATSENQSAVQISRDA